MAYWRRLSLPLLLLLLAAARGSAAAPIYATTFADGLAWKPVEGMQTRVVASPGEPKRALLVSGRQEGGWNYAASPSFPLQAGHKYRLSAQLKVDKVRPRLAPFFKVECTGAVSKQCNTGRYDLEAAGWQTLVAEFECPADDDGGWIAVEKGTNGPVEFEGRVGEVRLVEIDHYSVEDKYRFTTVPEGLARLGHNHPRLHLTSEGLAALKARLGEEPYATLLAQLREVADRRAKEGPPAYAKEDRYSGEEQLYQREVGNAIPHLALMYALTGERKYLDSAQAWMLASARYPTWGLGSIDGMDLAAGHQLYGLALAYDWLYHDLDPAVREEVRACLVKRGTRMYEALLNGQAWWADSYLQNHQWVDMTGLAAAGLALYGEVPGVEGWALKPLEMARVTMASLGPDGASHEGLPYWSYGLEYLLKFMDLARGLLGTDLFAHNAWFQHTASFRLYGMLPQASWSRESDLMTFADGPRYDWYGPDYMLRKLAAEYRDGHAQWLAEELRRADLCGDAATFLNLLWEDPRVKPTPPGDLPTFHHFADMDEVYLRSSWAGDGSLLAFKCGPHIGRHALARYSYDPGSGHVHPDAGAFQLFAHGDWLIVDDGYTWKTTAFQNTVLVNGVGQEGEGSAWFNGEKLCAEKRGAKILRADPDYLIGDVTAAYKEEAKLTHFRRHLRVLGPDLWVIVDDLEAASPSTFEAYFHADFPFVKQPEGAFRVVGKKGALQLTALSLTGLEAKSWRQPLKGTGGEPSGEIEALTVSNATREPKAIFVTVLEAYPANGAPQYRAQLSRSGGRVLLSLSSSGGTRQFELRLDPRDPKARALVETK